MAGVSKLRIAEEDPEARCAYEDIPSDIMAGLTRLARNPIRACDITSEFTAAASGLCTSQQQTEAMLNGTSLGHWTTRQG